MSGSCREVIWAWLWHHAWRRPASKHKTVESGEIRIRVAHVSLASPRSLRPGFFEQTYPSYRLLTSSRYFKTRVYETNYSNVEKILLMKVNFQETMRLLLQNAFQHDDPELTSEMLALYQQCPTLFNTVLSRTDRNEMDALLDNEDHEMEIDQSADSNHLRPAAINRIPTKSVVATHPINDGNRIPTRSGDLNTTSTWRGHLRLAYQYDYGKPAQYPSLFENRPIQWSRKSGFTDRCVPDHQVHTPESPPLPLSHHRDT